ncbi:substrate-binding domain-containing protein [Candidatus Marinarcus aquaticus]|uniref:Sugar ABC transporter substrate-binding protein n=1 Tax=Candidatus Marinarcus aquaticus TaxID=2044504 RepID=A0A4Q0XUZ8_9BACT|nr:substrate-binding domain-containing protein [Candidatus Marinarcus aquaticus]RXJ60795.1 sugar ABC transporter substrate-binding protein [Candidatus Marinarcus aquaticus]
MKQFKQAVWMIVVMFVCACAQENTNKQIAYIASDRSIPFWQIMGKGVVSKALEYGYEIELLDSKNLAKVELEHTIKAIQNRVDAIIISPTNSSRCVTVLKLAQAANIPVVVLDIGTDAGEYLSFISADNKKGAYDIGKVLANKMKQKGIETGEVGIIAIPQKRLNGQLRTTGFMQAMQEEGIKTADIKQQVNFSLEETYMFANELIIKYDDLKAIWLQGSDKYQGALNAIKDANKEGEILLITFDAEPEFLELIPKEVLVGAAMQQPFLMGQEAVVVLHEHFNGNAVARNIQLPILAISQENIHEKLFIIKRNVLGLEGE